MCLYERPVQQDSRLFLRSQESEPQNKYREQI